MGNGGGDVIFTTCVFMLVRETANSMRVAFFSSARIFYTIIMLMDTQNSFVGQAPTSTPEPQAFNNYDQPKKKSAMPIIVALILVILALGGVTAFLLLKNNNSTTTSKEDKKSEDIEAEITSETVKKDLLSKIFILMRNNNSDYDYKDDSFVINDYLFPFDFFKNGSYTDDEKLLTIAMDIFSQGNLVKFNSSSKAQDIASKLYSSISNDSTERENFISRFPTLNDYVNDEWSGYIEASKVNDKYKNLFGEDIKTHKSTGICGDLGYSSALSIYFTGIGGQCGGASPNIISFYVDSYSKKGNEAYVDAYITDAVNYGKKCAVWPITGGEDDEKTCTDDEKKALDNYKSIINSTNKENYDHYRFIFSGENSDYHFVKVEKIKK